MAVTRTQTATVKVATGIKTITSNTLTTVAGRSLFAAVSMGATSPTWSTITDSKGNTWAFDKTLVVGSLGVAICSCLAPGTVGASHTVTATFTSSGTGDMAIAFFEYSGLPSNVALVSSNSNSGTGTAVTSGAAACNDYCLTLIAECNAGSPTITPGSAWTQVSENESGSGAQPLNVSELIAGWGTLNGSWTLNGSNAWVAVVSQYLAMQRVLPPVPRQFRAVRRASFY